MPRRSKVELSPETIAELEEQFYNFLHSLSPEETNKFFKEFLTTEEKMMMYKRLALYWSLFEGYSLASIQRMLGITHDTTRIYNKRKNEMSEDFKNLLHRIGRDENGQPMKEDVVEEKSEDAPVVVEETITVVEEVITQEPQNEEQESNNEKMEDEAVHSEAQDQQKEEMETKPDYQEVDTEEKVEAQNEESEEKKDENKDEENPEKKKKGFGRFFGF